MSFVLHKSVMTLLAKGKLSNKLSLTDQQCDPQFTLGTTEVSDYKRFNSSQRRAVGCSG